MPDPRATGGDRCAPVILAFDTAASSCSVAIGRGNTVLAHERREMRHGHAEALLPMIDRVTAAAGTTPGEIETIAVTVGPGGFTGIRAGLAAAQGLALASGARLVGVASFAAVAARLPRSDEPLLVALDSRRADLYVQLFAENNAFLSEPAAVPPGELTAFVAVAIGNATLRIAGDAVDSAAAALVGRGGVSVIPGSAPDARGVLGAATDGKFAGPARPLYLRPPDVSFPKSRVNGGGSS
jgi:tRNA threonylcarbamoyladenosine biosynthesis protein TsaB